MQNHWRKGLVLTAALSAGISGWIVGCGGDDEFLNVGGTDSGTDATATDAGKLDATTDGTTPNDGGTTDGGDGSTFVTDGGDAGDAAGDAGPPTYAGVTTPFDQWTWIPIAGAVCADGSPTGIAVNPHAGSTNLTVYFEGGGACWTDATCQGATSLASYLNGYGVAQFNAEFGDAGTGGPLASTGVFERTSANPLQEENFVYVPYCTGDIHAGNNPDAGYTNETDGGTLTIHHVGYNNAKLDIAAVRAAIPSVNRLVVTGSSAGGYGALFNYEQIHTAFSEAKTSFLIDDSGPPLAAGSEYVNQNAKWNSWANVPTDCPACTPADGGAFENIYPYLTHQDPNFKGSLLETDHDEVISAFFSSTPPYGALVNGDEFNAGCAVADGGVGDAGGIALFGCQFTDYLYNVYTGGVQAANTAGPGQMHAFIENAAFHTYLLTPDKFAAVAPFLASQLGQDGGLDGGWTDQVPSGTGSAF